MTFIASSRFSIFENHPVPTPPISKHREIPSPIQMASSAYAANTALEITNGRYGPDGVDRDADPLTKVLGSSAAQSVGIHFVRSASHTTGCCRTSCRTSRRFRAAHLFSLRRPISLIMLKCTGSRAASLQIGHAGRPHQ
jgi:hypothetical protein